MRPDATNLSIAIHSQRRPPSQLGYVTTLCVKCLLTRWRAEASDVPLFPPWKDGCDLGLPSLIPLYPAHNPPPPPLSSSSGSCNHESVSAWMKRMASPPQKEEREEGGPSVHSLPSEAEYPAWCHGCFRVTFCSDLHMTGWFLLTDCWHTNPIKPSWLQHFYIIN